MSHVNDRVSGWITDLNAADETAMERIFDRYFHQVVELARCNHRLQGLTHQEIASKIGRARPSVANSAGFAKFFVRSRTNEC